MSEVDTLLNDIARERMDSRFCHLAEALSDERTVAAAEHAQACLLLKKLARAARMMHYVAPKGPLTDLLAYRVTEAEAYLAHPDTQDAVYLAQKSAQ